MDLSADLSKVRICTYTYLPTYASFCIYYSFLAHGASKIKTAVDFGLGEATISRILDQVTQAIIDVLAPKYLAYPTREEWIEEEKGFWRRWNVPNVSIFSAAANYFLTYQVRRNLATYYYITYFVTDTRSNRWKTLPTTETSQ